MVWSRGVSLRYSPSAIVPFAILTLLLLLKVFSAWRLVPAPESVILSLAELLGQGNYLFIASATVLENIAVLNSYFPGAFVILFSMATTHGHPDLAVRTYLVIFISGLAAHQVNFLVGRALPGQPTHRAIAEAGTVDASLSHRAFGFLTYAHPQLASLQSLQLGVNRTPYLTFIIRVLVGWGFWSIFWGVSMYQLGRVPISGAGLTGILYAYLIGWGLFELLDRSPNPEPAEPQN